MASRKHYDFDMMVSGGYISDHTFNHKFGAVPSMASGTTGSVWDIDDTVYPWAALDTPAVVNVERTNADDNGETVTVEGLDGDYLEVSEDIVISGADQVGTQLFKRINRAFISGGSTNAGNIDIEAGAAGGTTVARIQAGRGQTLMAVFTVPAGKTAYMYRITATAQATKDATGLMYVREGENTAYRINHTWEFSGGGEYITNFAFPLPVSEKSDIDMRITTRANNGRYTIAFDVLLVDND
jgi:hypothetical protein|tara:strand:+ start:127 stop:849 length:723 start_codon:yes stop_codon:yes gene_type:complete